jgi:hypothetical protein
MNKFLEEYLKYLKDNPKGYWFRARLYGFGWTPATWQGWLITAGFIGALLWVGADFGKNPNPSGNEINWFFVKIILLVATLIAICVIKGEKPKWNWGLPKNNNEQNYDLIGEQGRAKQEHLDKIIKLFDSKDKVMNDDVEKLLGVSDKTVQRYFNELESQGKIKQVGETGKGVYYIKA